MKTKLMLVALLLSVSTAAGAMDDTERARQMALYNAQIDGGATTVTETTITPQETTTTRTTTTQIPAAVTTYGTAGLSQRSLPETATVAVPETRTETITNKQMSPLNDDGTPMNVEPRAQTLGTAAEISASSPAAIQVTAAKTERERQLEAWQAWQAANAAAAPAPAPALAADAAPVTIATGPVTTTEKTMTTNYTVTTRKVGIVGSRPYPARTSQMEGGVTRETNVNGQVTTEVVAPDPVAPLKDQPASGDYYASPRGADVYRGTVGSVRVHETGRFN